jgi:hypothetical protein
MGGGAFILLKSRRAGPESAKQVEIRLANLLKILQIAVSAGQKASPTPNGSTVVVFVGISVGHG